jgi:hypothetical protein
LGGSALVIARTCAFLFLSGRALVGMPPSVTRGLDRFAHLVDLLDSHRRQRRDRRRDRGCLDIGQPGSVMARPAAPCPTT